ncbi:MAG: bifunctional riboflavin kinase/FAD synthetase [Pseudomonadota bacterium]
MEVIRGLQNLRPAHRGSAVTIGNFDGVHRGHQAVLSQLEAGARARDLPATLITFEPHPAEYFAPEAANARITRLREKVEVLRTQPVERVLCLKFDRRLAAMGPDEFIRRVLVEGLGTRYLVVGDDFRFGNRRAGTFETLEAAGAEHRFEVERTRTYALDGERVSSTRVRDALTAGELGTAAELLGRPYRLCGRVVHGDRRGRTIGFPTANVPLYRRKRPLSGVYAVWFTVDGGAPRPAVANVGTRPTVDGTEPVLEVHLFDFDGDLYGRPVSVEFVEKIRDERRFDSLEALTAQIDADAAAARRRLGVE